MFTGPPMAAGPAPAGSVLFVSIAVAVLFGLAMLFGVQQWRERRRRGKDLAAADARYFARQDARRLAGSTLMLLIAAGMVVGLSLDPRAGRLEAQRWGLTWLFVSLLVVALLLLALLDWLAIRRYAGRHRRALEAERRAILEAGRQEAASRRLGPSNPGQTNGPPGRQPG